MDNSQINQANSLGETKASSNDLLDPCGRLWLFCLGLILIAASTHVKEVNTLVFLVGSAFAVLSLNGARLSKFTVGKEEFSAETPLLIERVSKLDNQNATEIKVGDDGDKPQTLSELLQPVTSGIATEGYGLAQLIDADEKFKASVLGEIASSAGIADISKQSIVGIGRLQEAKSSSPTKLFALMDNGSNFVIEYPASSGEAMAGSLSNSVVTTTGHPAALEDTAHLGTVD